MIGNENFRLLVLAFRWGSRLLFKCTGERSVYWERPNRRLATVNRAGRTKHPRKAASSWG
jgi:hypothetical protein